MQNYKLLLLISLFFVVQNLTANDGSFSVNGNQLIPVVETDISVKKEMLSINASKTNSNQVIVDVYYEFYNPGKQKIITVGFEAQSPYNTGFAAPVDGRHPHIHKFTAEMNGRQLPTQVAVVSDSLYYQNGKFKELSKQEINDRIDEYEEIADFRYVYHFDANFKPGTNIIKHNYVCDLSSFVYAKYEFYYILSAAARWANRQIDDFTLNINMGDNQLIVLEKSFFDSEKDWKIIGIGKKQDIHSPYSYYDEEAPVDEPKTHSEFYIKNGYISFHKNNFKPVGELYITSPVRFLVIDKFNCKETQYISRDINYVFYATEYDGSEDEPPVDEMSKKVLRNIPFAQRGYVFSNPELKKYFERQKWYMPDPDYKADLSKLPLDEQKWVQRWSE